MYFIIEYGCNIGTEHLAVEADSLVDAEQYAYQSAYSYREGYEGLHGVLSFAEFCEEEGYEDEDDEHAWAAYIDMVEWELHYHAHEFDSENEDDVSILEDCEGKFFRV